MTVSENLKNFFSRMAPKNCGAFCYVLSIIIVEELSDCFMCNVMTLHLKPMQVLLFVMS